MKHFPDQKALLALSCDLEGDHMNGGTMKYLKPKILLIDLEEEIFESLQNTRLNVKNGTFGSPFNVPVSATMTPCVAKVDLPNHSEQEIIFIDLEAKFINCPFGEKRTPNEDPDLWIKQNWGKIDPRFRAAKEARSDFNRVLSTGGVFVIFASSVLNQTIEVGKFQHSRYHTVQSYEGTVWDFLTCLSDLQAKPATGTEMKAASSTSLGKLIEIYLPDSSFNCTLAPTSGSRYSWLPLVKNKFEQTVGIAHVDTNGGMAIILPQISNKARFIRDFLTVVLPEISPKLFPEHSVNAWTDKPPYELPNVRELTLELEAEIAKHEKSITLIKEKIQIQKTSHGWMHELLTETGDKLVASVKRALEQIGFSEVVDMDQFWDNNSNKKRREDLQIRNNSHTLVVDIKGITGFPSDDDSRQADKHAVILSREENRQNITGLTIINHQRNLPPLERENEMPYRQEIIDYALEMQLGLLTTWDIYKILINQSRNHWSFEVIAPIFYSHGKISPIPSHYQYLGSVAKVFTGKFGIDVENGTISKKDRFAIEFALLFEEHEADSLMVNGIEVSVAQIGDKTGLPWPGHLTKIRSGQRVYRIIDL